MRDAGPHSLPKVVPRLCSPVRPITRLPGRAVAVGMALAGLMFTGAHAQSAAPAAATAASVPPAWTGNDPVTRLLAERGLLPGAPGASAAPAGPLPLEAPAPTAVTPSLLQTVRDKSSDLVLAAMNFLGVPYRHGGNSAAGGFDCSGFTRYIFELSLGLVLPRRADDQASASGLFEIQRSELKPGDLVFFNTLRRTFSHVGIYVGDGKFIHSPRAGSAVRIEDMRMSYWQQRFTGARRVDAEIVGAAAREAQGSR